MADFTSGKNWSDFYSGILPPSNAAPAQPAVNWDQFYSGIIPSAPAAPSVVSPNLTADERALLQQQMQQSQALQAGYNSNGTPKIRPSWTIPAAPPVITPNTPASDWNRIDQAGYNATKKPGTWLAQSRMNAQALMRQMAALQGGMPVAPGTPIPAAVPARDGGLAALITGKGTPRAKTPSLVSLLGATGTSTNGYVYQNGARVGVDPKYAGLTPSQRDAMLTAKPSKQDALIARATGAASSAEHDAWRKKTYGGDGYAMGGG